MEIARLRIKGHWAHFKKPETNNNPLTHDFITKTALIGLMGAVLGIDREQMRPLFPIFSEDFRYGVALESPVWKQSWGFTLRRFDPDKARLEPSYPAAPRAFEFLREPSFSVALALINDRSRDHFLRFVQLVQASEAHYDPILGLHNCPAEIELLGIGEAEAANGNFVTRGFVPRGRLLPKVDVKQPFRVGFERLPTYQNDAMWNPPDRYVEVVYADVRRDGEKLGLSGEGEHFRLTLPEGAEEAWCLI